ncbi:MAG: ethylbenzene dehydrogenase-related protein [Alphaproteobacteria bacterium]
MLTGAVASLAGAPGDWSQVPVHTVKLFYPGQSGYDWVRSSDHKRAYSKVIEGDSCASCHEGEQADIGALIVSGERLEPNPIPGKNGSVDLQVQVAYDAENAYFRFQWRTNMNRAGQMHDYMRFDGEKWSFFGGARSDTEVASGEQPPLYEDRLAMMVDDGSVPMFKEQGCWLTCHDGMRDMPDMATKDQVTAHALLGDAGLKESDVRKYLPASRSDEAISWDATRTAEDIAAVKAAGGFADLMQWRAARSNPVGMADDGYVLEYRLNDDGKAPFAWNVDRKTMTPKFMFDAGKVGMKAITVADIGDPTKPYAMIREGNAVPYDPNAGWNADDVLPGRLLSREDATGSAADNGEVMGEWNDSMWTVVWTRKLDTGHPQDDKILAEGKAYTVGFAVHDDNVTTRFHFVGFPVTIGFGAPGDIEATKVP